MTSPLLRLPTNKGSYDVATTPTPDVRLPTNKGSYDVATTPTPDARRFPVSKSVPSGGNNFVAGVSFLDDWCIMEARLPMGRTSKTTREYDA